MTKSNKVVQEETNELNTTEEVMEVVKIDGEEVQVIQNGKNYCSFPTETTQNKKDLYNMIQQTDKGLSDCKGEKFYIAGFLFKDVIKDDEVVPFSIIRDTKGVSYATISKGVKNNLVEMIALFGNPIEWDEPLEIEVRKKKTSNNKEMTYLFFT